MKIQESQATLETPSGPMRAHVFAPAGDGSHPGLVFFSEIYQVTGPIRRMAAFLAGHGCLVAVPEIYHELEPAGCVLAYDAEGTARGNAHKIEKTIESYDEDARAALAWLRQHPSCNGRLGAFGVCIGGHRAFRAAMNPEVSAAACFYATDIHSASLGKGQADDSLRRVADLKGEMLMIWGRQDPHIPLEGRARIHDALEEHGVDFTWHEFNAEHAFMRDEGPRYNPALARVGYDLVREMIDRRLR